VRSSPTALSCTLSCEPVTQNNTIALIVTSPPQDARQIQPGSLPLKMARMTMLAVEVVSATAAALVEWKDCQLDFWD